MLESSGMEQLEGKVAVVTGAGSGIGAGLVRRFTAEGMHVVAADIEGTDVVRCDVTRYDDVAALADHAYATHGAVHVLCNNAGVFAGGLMWERPESDFEWVFGVNVWGILHAIRAFVPRMLESGEPGHIVNTSSTAGLATNAFSGPYTISKFAALAATECLAHDLASIGAPIQVSAVVPGSVNTGIAKSRRNRPDELAAEMSDDAQFVEQALDDLCSNGMEPDDAADIIVDAIRAGDFLIPTRPSYAGIVRERADALVAKRLPPMPTFD